MHPETQTVPLLLCLSPGKVLDLGRELAKLLLEESKPSMQRVVLGHADVACEVSAKLSSLSEHIPASAMFRFGVVRGRRVLFFEHLLGGRSEGLAE
jgi:hypothetical protein